MRYPSVILVAVFLASAVMADVPISTPGYGPTVFGVGRPDIVPLGDGFLAIWGQGSPCADQELRGMRLDRNGVPRDPASFVVVPAAYQMSFIGTAADGGDAYVAWHSYPGKAHLARVTSDGSVTTLSDSIPMADPATKIRVSNGKVLFLGPQPNLNQPLTATLVDRTGTLVRSGVTLVGSSVSTYDLVAANGSFLFGWAGADGLHITNIAPADVAANNVPATPALPKIINVSRLRLASNGVHSMASWFDSVTHELRILPLSTSGTPLGEPVTIGSFAPAGAPMVVPVNDGYAIFFPEAGNGVGQTVALRVSAEGTLRSIHRGPAINAPAAAAQNGDWTVAAWNESQFFKAAAGPIASDGTIGAGTTVSLEPVVQHVRKFLPFAGGTAALWTDSMPNERVVVGRISASGAPVDGEGLRLRDSTYDQGHSAIATDGERLYVVFTEGDPSWVPQTLYGAVVSFSGSPSVSVKQLASDAAGGSDVAVAWNGQTFTVVYQRSRTHSTDLAALRVDRSGNVVDPDPIPLTPARVGDENPRLSWNGNDYLLVWQRWYDPFTYIGETCYPPPPPLPAELFAQRFSASFTPTSAEIPLATTTNKGDYLLDVRDDDVSFVGGIWLVLWFDKARGLTRYARIDTSGVRLDPLNGRLLSGSYDDPILVPTADGWTVAGHEGYGSYGAGRGLALARIDVNGLATSLPTMPLSGTSAVEAVALTPVPLVAYKRSTSSAAFVGLLTQRSRAAHH